MRNSNEELLEYLTIQKESDKLKKLKNEIKNAKRYTSKFIPPSNKHKPIVIELTLLEKEMLLDKILEFHIGKPTLALSTISQIVQKSGMISFIPYEYILGFVCTIKISILRPVR